MRQQIIEHYKKYFEIKEDADLGLDAYFWSVHDDEIIDWAESLLNDQWISVKDEPPIYKHELLGEWCQVVIAGHVQETWYRFNGQEWEFMKNGKIHPAQPHWSITHYREKPQPPNK